MSNYQLVFDAAAQGYTTWRAAILPASIAVVGILLAVASHEQALDKRRGLNFYQTLAASVGVLAALGCVAMLVHTWREYDILRGSLRSGNFRLVEGRVTGLVPEGPDGHPMETFRVDGTRFTYSTSDITSAFHWTVARGGPIREGLRVRIADVNGAIARLEIAR